jgi:hypothetical protein
MDQRLAEYREYYRARARRYADNPAYPNTAEAERQLCATAEAATSMDDLRAVLAHAHLQPARALARDRAAARAAAYARTGDLVRANAPACITEAVEQAADPAAITSAVARIETEVDALVTRDELGRLWTQSLPALENIEVWTSAVVPDRWRRELDGFARDAAQQERGSWARAVSEAQAHAPGWQFDPDVARAARHRRLVPLSDATFERRLAQHAELIRAGA